MIVELGIFSVVLGSVLFFVSFVMHMVLPHHRGDFRALPKPDVVEERLCTLLRAVEPGNYAFPYTATLPPSEAWRDRASRGAVGFLQVVRTGSADMDMTPYLVLTYLWCVLSSAIVFAVLPASSVSPWAFAVVVALTHAGSDVWHWIWYTLSTYRVASNAFDACVYGAVAAAVRYGLHPWLMHSLGLEHQ